MFFLVSCSKEASSPSEEEPASEQPDGADDDNENITKTFFSLKIGSNFNKRK